MTSTPTPALHDYLSRHYTKADQLMLKLGYLLFAYSLVLAFWYQTWAEALIIGSATLGAMYALVQMMPGQVLTRATMGAGFMMFAALHIHQAQGMVEFHFGIFAFMAALLYYRDWVPIVAGLAVVAVHHFSFYYLQVQGLGVWIVEDTDSGWWIIFVHAGYAIMEALILIWVASVARREANQGLELMRAIEAADGEQLDLTQRTPGDRQVLKHYNRFAQALEQLVREVKQLSARINDRGRELGHTTVKMYEHLHTQQQQTDHIADTISGLSASARQVSSHAAQANDTVQQTRQAVTEATQVSEQTSQAMGLMASEVETAATVIDALNTQADKIGRVMDVIRSVAEQTNLLALNAAIEAARAGDQGRGFAVVADEVRTLAQRTQASTVEINSIIEQLQADSSRAVNAMTHTREQVQSCLDNTAHSLGLMQQIHHAMQTLGQLNRDIAHSTGEQEASASAISQGASASVAAGKHSVDYAESAAQAGRELLTIAEQMNQLVTRFKVQDN